MMIAYAHGGACDCPGYPGQSALSDGHLEGQHDINENTIQFRMEIMSCSKYGLASSLDSTAGGVAKRDLFSVIISYILR